MVYLTHAGFGLQEARGDPAMALVGVAPALDVARSLLQLRVQALDAIRGRKAARECRAVITVEEHLIYGGLGEACAGVIAQAGLSCRFKIIGIPDEYTVTGSQADIFRHYGISMEGLAQTALALLNQ